MNKMLFNLFKKFPIVLGVIVLPLTFANGSGISGCSDAGTASASIDSVCYTVPVTLSTTGYIGTLFQWQSFDGATWIDETGAGATTDTFMVTLTQTTRFRVIVTENFCPPDTSNEVEVTVGTVPVPTGTPATRCGPGIVNLQGTGAGTLEWYTDQTGGTLVATGSNTTAFIPATTTLWVADNVLGGSTLASGLQITEVDLGNTDHLEVQNVSPLPLDVTGWKVVISDSYTNINIVNPNVQVLSGILQPGDILTWSDATGANYWGSNMFWNPGSFPSFTGWALILDDQDNPMDLVVWAWPAANIQSMSVVVQGVTVNPAGLWSGDGINSATVAATDGLSRTGNSDNDVATDFVIAPLSIGLTNIQMTLPFTGFGCSSPRVPVDITITPSDSISIDASATSFCLNGSATLTAISNNPNYSYTWSPATGLSGTTGATVTSTPPGPGNYTYVVVGDDGTCSNVDTVVISVGIPTLAGTASTAQDTVCLGKDTDLILAGSSGTIQWQSLSGGIWVNETGPGSDSSVYNVSPVTNTTYRAYVYSGSCPPDSSNILDIAVLSITNPVTVNDTICGGGNLTLTASGSGNLSWYAAPVGGAPITTGTSYTYNASQTDTFYVEAFAGTEYFIGPPTSGFGNQQSTASNNYGLAFDVIRPVNIDVVHIYPNSPGTVTINLRVGAGGAILDSYTQTVQAFTGKTPIPVSFSVPVGTGYKLEIVSGGPSLQQNTTGAVYPYTVPNGPLSITGYYNPNFNTGVAYLWMYDWIVSEGCRSQRIPTIGVVNAFPPLPIITQNWNTLMSSSPTGNQWIYNGAVIPGATDQVLVITQTGNYVVAVTINGCTTLSPVFQVTTIGLNELPSGIINIYPNPVSDLLEISFNEHNETFTAAGIIDITGRTVVEDKINSTGRESISIPVSKLRAGIYTLELKSSSSVVRKQFVVQH